MNTSTLTSTSTSISASAPASRRRAWLHSLLATDASVAPLVLRATLAVVMIPHGAQKLFGWFGGGGFRATMAAFTDGMGLPWIVALAVVLIESLGSLALLLGLGTRVMAAGLAAVMIGAIATVHAQHGFFMDWAGTQGGQGFEYHLLAIGIAVALMITGGGRASVDAQLARRA